ncbi:ATP synthase epsilon chain [bacterium BMS3Bbin06]|nr:ATP synthase epsilon chain [bacterium BMS3Abin08]GBE35683.1 ATP synthase epsilon chain [bacterium BMS3Bbin06]HDH01339.1 F0F1 ATP synthase subunit epsilon [Nitrospirota bacterium]HDO35641.1 F0F1 ATP synthase subunit epsilon [Nitrospirota bacterium]HDY70740.1 F0F1 ATP synthase subunit epsilon [Nitrospirota bacterium]
MAEKLMLEIVSPHGAVLKEEVDEVIAPGSEGEFGVLPGHISFVTTLKVGVLVYKQGGAARYVFVNSGYSEVSGDTVLVLADSAERAEAIDVERAKEAMKRAEERLQKKEEFDYARARASLERALTRIELSEKKTAR